MKIKSLAMTATILLIAALLVLGACQDQGGSDTARTDETPPPSGQTQSGETPTAAEKDLPTPEGEALWTYITETSPYEGWDMWPGYDGMYPGKSPHGAHLKLYGNKVAIQAARAGQAMPDGAIIVKENYAKDRQTLAAITPMYKVEGYNPSAGDWFWAKYGADGKVMAAGKVDSCIDCHDKAGDYRFTKAR